MFMAIVSAGFVAVPLNLVAGASILAYTVEHAEVQLILLLRSAGNLSFSLKRRRMTFMVLLDPITGPDLNAIPKVENKLSIENKSPASNDVALLMYTSGPLVNQKA